MKTRARSNAARTAPWLPAFVSAAVFATLLLADRLVRFYQGDSISYLSTGTSGWIPPDRSWAYGYGARWVVEAAHSVTCLVVLQVLLLLATILLMLRLLARPAGAPPRQYVAALVFAVLASLDPLNQVYARFWLSDTVSACAFLAFVAALAGVLAAPRPVRWIPVITVVSLASVFVRVAYAPVEIATLLIALVAGCAIRRCHRPTGLRTRLAALVAVPVLAAALLAGANARVALPALRGHISLNHLSPLYTLGVFLPGLRYEDFRRAAVPITQQEFSALHLGDYDARGAQMWSDGPHYVRSFLQQKLGTDRIYDPRLLAVCSAIVRSALLHHPQTLAVTYVHSLALYFLPEEWSAGLEHHMGFGRPLPEWVAQYLTAVSGQTIRPEITAQRSLTTRLLGATIGFYPILLAVGALSSIYVLARMRPFGSSHVVAAAILASLLVVPLYSHIVIPRYLIAAVPLSELLLAMLLCDALRCQACGRVAITITSSAPG